MLLRYRLSESQYQRFQHPDNNEQIQGLAQKVGVIVTDEFVENGVEMMRFRGRCAGTMALVRDKGEWTCVVRVQSKPWWLPRFVLDYGFREALK
jgi:hypothetical protein